MALAQVYEFKYPPEQELCLKHRLATRIWKGIHDENQIMDICQCCGRKVGNQDIPTQCCYSSEQLSFLGVGLPLFFSFLRYSILLLIILSLIFCVFGLYTNIVSKNCQPEQKCTANIFNTLSIVNKKNENDYMSIQNYILISFVVISVFIFQLFRYRFRKIVEQIDEFSASPSDYSLILKRLPEDTTKKDIQEWIQHRRGYLDEDQRIATNNLQLVNIIMSYDLTQWNEQRSTYLSEFKKMIKQGKSPEFHRPNLPKPTTLGYIAIVIFTKQASKQLFIEPPKFDQIALHYIFSSLSPLSDDRIKGERICIARAPQPDDILWNNVTTTAYQGISRKIVLGFISLILLAAGGFAQYGLAVLQRDTQTDKQKILISTLASILVTITNLILQYFLIYSTYWQKMTTMTQYTQVVTFKLVFQQFLNAGIFVVAANIAANYQTFNIQTNLSETITQIMLLNAITPNISNFFIYKCDISGKLTRYFCIKKQCMIFTQLQANNMSILPTPILPEKYSYIIKTIWLSAFYAPFVPIVVPISIVGLTINYFVEKHLFGGAYSAPNMISAAVNKSCVQLFEYVPLVLSLGQWLIYLYFKKFDFASVPVNWSVPIYLSIGISIINLILPMSQINKSICKIHLDLSQEPNYTQAQKEFEVTYEITNPVYQTQRPRLRDVYIWKKLFGHIPRSSQMKTYQANSTITDRIYQTPLLKYSPYPKY